MLSRDEIQDALSKDDDQYFDARSKAQIVTSTDRLRVVLRPLEDAVKAKRIGDAFPWLASTIGFTAPVVRQFNADRESIGAIEGTVTFAHWIIPGISLVFAGISVGIMVTYLIRSIRDHRLFKHSAETVINELTNRREPSKPSVFRNFLQRWEFSVPWQNKEPSDPPKLDLS